MKDRFSLFNIRDIFGIPQNRLQEWVTKDFIVPSIQKACGQGTRNIFTRDDVYRVGIFFKLLSLGFRRKTAAELVSSMLENSDILIFEKWNDFISITINYEKIKRDINDKIEDLKNGIS